MLAMTALIAASIVTPIAPAPSGAPRAIVRSDDLNLCSAEGADALRRRIDREVLALSGDQNVIGSIIPRADIQRARAIARQQAEKIIAAARHADG